MLHKLDLSIAWGLPVLLHLGSLAGAHTSWRCAIDKASASLQGSSLSCILSLILQDTLFISSNTTAAFRLANAPFLSRHVSLVHYVAWHPVSQSTSSPDQLLLLLTSGNLQSGFQSMYGATKSFRCLLAALPADTELDLMWPEVSGM